MTTTSGAAVAVKRTRADANVTVVISPGEKEVADLHVPLTHAQKGKTKDNQRMKSDSRTLLKRDSPLYALTKKKSKTTARIEPAVTSTAGDTVPPYTSAASSSKEKATDKKSSSDTRVVWPPGASQSDTAALAMPSGKARQGRGQGLPPPVSSAVVIDSDTTDMSDVERTTDEEEVSVLPVAQPGTSQSILQPKKRCEERDKSTSSSST